MKTTVTEAPFSVEQVRADFPALHQTVHGRPLVYFDNAATMQRPKCVLEAIEHFYTHNNSNVHRGVHALSERATADFENARETVREFINAKSQREIIFVRGATEAINLVAHSFGGRTITAGDNIVITAMEHHANIVPWQMLCASKNATLRVVPVFDNGELDLQAYRDFIDARTKLVAFIHVSNALGTINPAKVLIEMAHSKGAKVLVDGAQAMAHQIVDVQDLQADFYVFSAHKMLGPTGIGVLYAKEALLEAMPPYQTGGEMISQVSFTQPPTFNELPYKFEAGTPNIAGAIGLAAAIHYLQQLGIENIARYEQELLRYATARIREIEGLRIIGKADQKAPVISMVFDDIHAHDAGTILDHQGIAVRAGHHCAMPLMERFNVSATIRASFAFYNTFDEIDAMIDGLNEVKKVFG
ncbi:MAG: cysteine desulfurase [Pseudomonadota bacterium]|nr:cysteine desulfurase [Pseudomonadota bacterium]